MFLLIYNFFFDSAQLKGKKAGQVFMFSLSLSGLNGFHTLGKYRPEHTRNIREHYVVIYTVQYIVIEKAKSMLEFLMD